MDTLLHYQICDLMPRWCSLQSSWSLAGCAAFHTASITSCITLALTRSIPLLKCPVMFLPEGRWRQTVACSHKCQSGAMLTSRWDSLVRAIVMSRFKRDWSGCRKCPQLPESFQKCWHYWKRWAKEKKKGKKRKITQLWKMSLLLKLILILKITKDLEEIG